MLKIYIEKLPLCLKNKTEKKKKKLSPANHFLLPNTLFLPEVPVPEDPQLFNYSAFQTLAPSVVSARLHPVDQEVCLCLPAASSPPNPGFQVTNPTSRGLQKPSPTHRGERFSLPAIF